MQVRKASAAPTPEYPDRREFQQYQHLLGAAILGVGLAASGCTKKTSGVIRAVGESPNRPTEVEPPTRLMGDMMQVPKPEPEAVPTPPAQGEPARPPAEAVPPRTLGKPQTIPSPAPPSP